MKNRNIILTTILFALGSFALPQRTQAVSPPPDGGYPGGNTAEGYLALGSLTTGVYNTGIGVYSLLSIADGSLCTSVGAGALFANTASENTATGAGALFSNTTGGDNTANGAFALFSNASGIFNTATGFQALENSTGDKNTGNGADALLSNTSGGENTADGNNALRNNTTANFNTAAGASALVTNTTGHDNTAVGTNALFSNTTANFNTGVGSAALGGSTGDSNTAMGFGALQSDTTGSNNVALGAGAGSALTTGDNNICIGHNVTGVAGDADTIRIGNVNTTTTFVRGISGTAVTGTPVVVNGNGQLGVTPSSKRFKDEIKPMEKASEVLLALKPVTFRYKKEIDPAGTSQFGLVAEEVEKVNRDLVVHDKKGKPYSVRYEQVNAMLLNEFLKEHRTVQELRNEIAALTSTVKEQAAQIQKVSAQVELNKPTQPVARIGK
jgi:Chaperone of endosialidase